MPEFTSLSPIVLAWACAVMALAGLVHGMLGLGFPLIATPLLALVTDVKTAIALTLAPTLTVLVFSVARGRDWRGSLGKHWFLPLYMIVGSFLGARLLIVANSAPFTLALALLILAYLNLERLGKTSWSWVKERPQLAAAAFGLVAGLSESTTNVSGPPLLIYFLTLGTEPRIMVRALNLCFLSGKSTQAITLVSSGALSLASLVGTLPFALIGVGTLRAGTVIRDRVNPVTYRRWLKGALWGMAVLLLGQFLRQAYQ